MIDIRKKYGVFETPVWIFEEYIFPRIRNILYNYIWVDLFCGSGNLILPILKYIPSYERVSFFKKHIFMYDVLPEMVNRAIENAIRYGIPREVAVENIVVRDTLKNYPRELLNSELDVYHITNPPYMYIGYIKKNNELRFWLEYFKGDFEGYQDLYQLALANDAKHGISRMIYVIPTNFLYGASVSNKIRDDILRYYYIREAVVFEKQLFDYTGQHVGIFFFERKDNPKHESQKFTIIKVSKTGKQIKTITINPRSHYRSNTEFEEFVQKYRAAKPLKITFYLYLDEVVRNQGNNKVVAIDSNSYNGFDYERRVFYVNDRLYKKIKNNILFVKTIDGVRENEKAGIYVIKDYFNADCIVVTKSPYRTHPIQLFFEPEVSVEDQLLLKDYFNFVLNSLRELTDSEFMTTYKYANTSFTRKYLGLTQVKKLIETFPILTMNNREKEELKKIIEEKDFEKLCIFLKKEKKGDLLTWMS